MAVVTQSPCFGSLTKILVAKCVELLHRLCPIWRWVRLQEKTLALYTFNTNKQKLLSMSKRRKEIRSPTGGNIMMASLIYRQMAFEYRQSNIIIILVSSSRTIILIFCLQ